MDRKRNQRCCSPPVEVAMITIFDARATDFSTLGLGALYPSVCEIQEQAGGMYSLEMEHPFDRAGKWKLLTV